MLMKEGKRNLKVTMSILKQKGKVGGGHIAMCYLFNPNIFYRGFSLQIETIIYAECVVFSESTWYIASSQAPWMPRLIMVLVKLRPM